MGSIAKIHHYLPQCYLSAFTGNGGKGGHLYVYDLVSQKSFSTHPKNVAAEKNFNRFEAEGLRPDFLETNFSSLENTAVAVMREMECSGSLAKPERLIYIINLITLLVVRNPRARRLSAAARKHTAKLIADLMVSDKRTYEHQLKQAREAGHVKGEGVSFDRMKNFINGGKYTIEVTRESLIRTELRAFDSVLKLIGSRYWSLLTSTQDSPDFITCDHPVTIAPKTAARERIGVGSRNTELIFPIGPRHALRGVFEDPFKPEVTIKPIGVAAMNARTIRHAERQIYSRQRQIAALQNGNIRIFDATLGNS